MLLCFVYGSAFGCKVVGRARTGLALTSVFASSSLGGQGRPGFRVCGGGVALAGMFNLEVGMGWETGCLD